MTCADAKQAMVYLIHKTGSIAGTIVCFQTVFVFSQNVNTTQSTGRFYGDDDFFILDTYTGWYIRSWTDWALARGRLGDSSPPPHKLAKFEPKSRSIVFLSALCCVYAEQRHKFRRAYSAI